MLGLIDSTLREGEQMAGIYFSLQQKVAIVQVLAKIGIEEIELGVAVQSPEMAALISQAREIAPETRLALWSRGLVADVRECAELKPDVLSISLPVSDLHIHKRLSKDRAWLLRQIPLVIDIAREADVPFVSLGCEDATRADDDFLFQVLQAAKDAGADRVRFSDTMGIAEPLSFAELIRRAKAEVSMQIAVHTHNDFGMATANAISALSVGAEWADVTVLGLGERAGNASLAEVAAYLEFTTAAGRYQINVLLSASQLLADIIGVAIPANQPIIGSRIFACESGLHLDGLAKDPRIYEPYPPEFVQGKRKMELGKKVGRNAVINYYAQFGITLVPAEAVLVTSDIRAMSAQLGRPLKDSELQMLLPKGISCR